jgi:hypothetical protein
LGGFALNPTSFIRFRMVALDNAAHFDAPPRRSPHLTLPLGLMLAAVMVFFASFALRGFSDNGIRFGTQLVWRFNSLIFFAALVAEPLGRMVPPLHGLADKGRPLLQGFCAAMAVYFGVLLVPNLLAVPDGIRPTGITAGMTFFVFFTGSVTLVLAAAVNRSLRGQLGEKASRAMLGIAMIYFWLCYSLIGLAHITGPHRPDAFYEISVMLMIVALLARFTEHFLRSREQASAA